MRESSVLRVIVGLAISVIHLAAVNIPQPVGPVHQDIQGPIAWTACPSDIRPFRRNNNSMALQCTNFSVPLSHNDLGGPQIQLGLVRLPAQGKRIGNLFVNPGGPGGAASGMLVGIASKRIYMSDAVRQNFDIIGMDPRGVGLSTPQRCDTNLANQPSEFDATTPEGFQKLVGYNKALGESCRALTGPLFDNMDTISVAKDMEAVRVALGNEPMNYFGVSYGTQLGAQFAALFPGTIRAMALDGMLQHTGSYASNIMTQATSLDATIQAFFRFCEADEENCGEDGRDIRRTWNKALEVAAAGDLKAAECDGTIKTRCLPVATPNNIIGAARSRLQVPKDRRGLAESLKRAAAGNGSSFVSRLASGDVFADSQGLAITTVQCQDGHFLAAKDHFEVQRIAEMTRTFTGTPGMAGFWRRVIDCTGYPVNVTNPRTALSIKNTQNPVLLVHSRFDPATSLVYANGMAEEFQDATLVLRDGSGHTSYILEGDASRLVDDYLINLEVPPRGTVVQN
ncbi:putative hydrolase [Colletotrichum tanaceti]|uniref:Putative hydrolase n=1 Tax=Colletotrichum tanaceti TaxID=1306861 RepID=A0A4U6X4E4_9PEZI|nr:putative hydrolase [Colletotrichum tanaceti]KAJ0167408.1 putative hydrolase [Colletotrichum tanaceti]TKW49894.1 putative hydrolase [Colletotrichum tanaceti]